MTERTEIRNAKLNQIKHALKIKNCQTSTSSAMDIGLALILDRQYSLHVL